MSALLTNGGTISATQWVLLGLILVLIIFYPIFTVYKNKKEREKFDHMAGSLKVGDKILTSSGTYGEIVSISQREQGKVLTIKTGDDKNVGYLSVDILTVYSVFRDVKEGAMPEVDKNEEVKAEEKKAEKQEPKAEKPKQAPKSNKGASKSKAKK